MAPNSSPIIQESAPGEGEDLEIMFDTQVAFIIASDPDEGDQLSFFWKISNMAEIDGTPMVGGDDESQAYGSRVEITQDPAYNGKELTAIVRDDHGGITIRSWPIIVLEEL